MAIAISLGNISTTFKNFKKQGKKVVLAGGCFDVIHPGHVIFLEKAKKQGDILVILLESDEKIKDLKGNKRPVHNQLERVKVLSALSFVDVIISLPFLRKEKEYDVIISNIKPDVIAATAGAKDNNYKMRAAKLTGSKLKYVTKMISNHSTSRILSI